MRRSYVVQTKQRPMPKFFQPKLDSEQKTNCRLIHWDLIDRLASGKATTADLWDWIETGLTYHRMMQLLEWDGTAFDPEALHIVTDQMAIAEPIIARYQKTGRVELTASELEIARAAGQVFNSLLDLDRNGISTEAALWSTEQMMRVQGVSARKKAAA